MVSAVVRRRGRGESAGIDLEQILTVAKSMPRSSLTMQSVANALGVDRKALYNYVPDRDGLLTLVALDAFAAQFATLDIARTSSWQLPSPYEKLCTFGASGSLPAQTR